MNTQFSSYLKYAGVLVCSALLLFACSKDDGPGNEPDPVNPVEKDQLILEASAIEIDEGGEVTFSVTLDGKAIEADIFIDDEKLSGTTHTFDSAGEYTAIAKKADYKDSEPLKITVKAPVKKVAKLTFNKVNTAPYTPAYGTGLSRMTMSKTHVYTFSSTTEKFKRYSLANDTWEELNHTNQLDFAGVEGKMLYVEEAVLGQDLIFYLANGKMRAYFPKETGGGIPFRDTWRQMDVANQYISGERAAAVHGKYLYYVGNQRNDPHAQSIDRYHPDTDTWETPAQLPLAVNGGAHAAIYNNKMYILGEVNPTSGDPRRVFYIYDTEQLTVKDVSLPEGMRSSSMVGRPQHLIAFENYVLFLDYYNSNNVFVFDIAANQWLENPIENLSDMFDRVLYTYLMSPSPDKLYAAGTKDGNFILYELEFTVVEE